MKAVSTNTLGMSGALSTAKLACSTLGLCRRPTPPISRSMAPPSCRLSLIWAVVLMSSRARLTWASCATMLTPPIKSALFSWLAIQRAALLVAPPWLRAKTLAPCALGVKKASAWMLTNKSACTLRAFCTRTCRGTKKSASRVKKARIGLPFTWVALMRSFRRWAICSTTSFSRVPAGPTAPGSSPPWPGSRAMMIKRSVRCGLVARGGWSGLSR